MTNYCAICGCRLHRGGEYATPTTEGRSQATKHHYVAERFRNTIPALINIRNKTSKPIMAVISYLVGTEYFQLANEITEELQKGGIPTFVTAEHGARALKNALDYHSTRDG